MPLKLMYLTNEPEIAAAAQAAAVDRVFLDLELRGKEKRQANLDTVISHNSIEDVARLRAVLHKTELLVRVNSLYDGSKAEIDRVIEDGADVVMLPYFQSVQEVQSFIRMVDGRVKTCLLCETPKAVEHLDEILDLDGIDEVHIGLNDLHLGYHMTFMFELLANGTVDALCEKFRKKGVMYGFGGVGRPGSDVALPADRILAEHCRLGSNMVILSRAFLDVGKLGNRAEIPELFQSGVQAIRSCERAAAAMSPEELSENHRAVQQIVQSIVEKKKETGR